MGSNTLAEITQRIAASGGDPSTYVDVTYRVSEAKLNMWPEVFKAPFYCSTHGQNG